MCLTVVLGRQATVDGSVLVGHNEENKGPYFANFRRVLLEELTSPSFLESRSTWPKEIRQPRYGFFWSQIPGREYSDSYLNDAGVVIVSNGCPSREDDLETLIDRQEIHQEGIGGLLRRVVAEQAGSAQEAVELIGRLVEQFGYRDSGRTYVAADPQEAWVVAVVRGRRWLAQRVPDDAAVVVPNVFIFDQIGLDASPAQQPEPSGQSSLPLAGKQSSRVTNRPLFSAEASLRCSADVVCYAIQRGWYDPASGKPFSFREAYQAPERNRPDPRQWWAQQLLLNPEQLPSGGGGKSSALDHQQCAAEQNESAAKAAPLPVPVGAAATSSPGEVDSACCRQPASDSLSPGEPARLPTGPLPWYVRPGRKLSVEDVAAILRNQQGPVPLFHPATQETAVFQLRAGFPPQIGCVYWRTVGRPDWSPLLPWYLGVPETPPEYCHPAFRTKPQIWNPAEPLAQEIFQPDPNLIWWKFYLLRQKEANLSQPTLQSIRRRWAELEQRLRQQQAELETQLLRLWSSDPAHVRRQMTAYCTAQSQAVSQAVDQWLYQWEQETL